MRPTSSCPCPCRPLSCGTPSAPWPSSPSERSPSPDIAITETAIHSFHALHCTHHPSMAVPPDTQRIWRRARPPSCPGRSGRSSAPARRHPRGACYHVRMYVCVNVSAPIYDFPGCLCVCAVPKLQEGRAHEVAVLHRGHPEPILGPRLHKELRVVRYPTHTQSGLIVRGNAFTWPTHPTLPYPGMRSFRACTQRARVCRCRHSTDMAAARYRRRRC